MKANGPIDKCAAMAATVGVMVLLGSCTAERAAPVRTPVAKASPAQPTPQPRPAAAPARWLDASATPGDWRWAMENGQSVARFAEGQLVLRCDPAQRLVTLIRSGAGEGAVPLVIATSSMSRALSADGISGTISAKLAASDSLLDAMAFSRGRFAVETGGLPTLYVPSWPEVSRVVEDCR